MKWKIKHHTVGTIPTSIRKIVQTMLTWVPCCDVRYDFRTKTMFVSSLPQVVCRRVYILFMLFVFVCAFVCPTHIVLCLCFVCLRLVVSFSGLSIFDCPLVFSNFNWYIHDRSFVWHGTGNSIKKWRVKQV